jgi:hypothetical protein
MMGGHLPLLMIAQKFLSKNIVLPLNADGNVIDIQSISINIGA